MKGILQIFIILFPFSIFAGPTERALLWKARGLLADERIKKLEAKRNRDSEEKKNTSEGDRCDMRLEQALSALKLPRNYQYQKGKDNKFSEIFAVTFKDSREDSQTKQRPGSQIEFTYFDSDLYPNLISILSLEELSSASYSRGPLKSVMVMSAGCLFTFPEDPLKAYAESTKGEN